MFKRYYAGSQIGNFVCTSDPYVEDNKKVIKCVCMNCRISGVYRVDSVALRTVRSQVKCWHCKDIEKREKARYKAISN